MNQQNRIEELAGELFALLEASEGGTIDEAIRRLLSHRMADGGDAGVCAILWLEDDVIAAAEMADLPSPEPGAAKAILQKMSGEHSAENGVNWDTLAYYVQEHEWERLTDDTDDGAELS